MKNKPSCRKSPRPTLGTFEEMASSTSSGLMNRKFCPPRIHRTTRHPSSIFNRCSERIPQTRHSKISLGFSLMFLLVASSLVAPGPLGEQIRVGATSHKLVAHVNLNGTVCTSNLKWHIVLYQSAVQVMLIVQACAPAN